MTSDGIIIHQCSQPGFRGLEKAEVAIHSFSFYSFPAACYVGMWLNQIQLVLVKLPDWVFVTLGPLRCA